MAHTSKEYLTLAEYFYELMVSIAHDPHYPVGKVQDFAHAVTASMEMYDHQRFVEQEEEWAAQAAARQPHAQAAPAPLAPHWTPHDFPAIEEPTNVPEQG